MLKSLRLKNWRSCKDVTIDDLQPINVFIGANSSGKTNILDSLYFVRSVSQDGVLQSVFDWGGKSKIRTISNNVLNSPVTIEIEFKLGSDAPLRTMQLEFISSGDVPFIFSQRLLDSLQDNTGGFFEQPVSVYPSQDVDRLRHEVFSQDGTKTYKKLSAHIDRLIDKRWQMLDENFMPELKVGAKTTGSIDVIDRCADNVISMLDFIKQARLNVHQELQETLRWLLEHVERVEGVRDARESKLVVYEKAHSDLEAPSMSSGTGRVFAMLIAIYILDVQSPEEPGLVVIEEPDAALNPGLLRKFVELLREFAGNTEKPRQFILTTHNPAFLNYFQPQEVRVVSRDDEGFTKVNRIPDYIREIWLDKKEYALGEVWQTNSFGGLP